MNDIQDQRPLTEAATFILLSLVPGPRHGYAIMKAVESLSDGRLKLSTGTLYGALKRFLDRGWIERLDEPVQNQDGSERKAYRLTTLGKQVLGVEVQRLEDLLAAARTLRLENRYEAPAWCLPELDPVVPTRLPTRDGG